MSFTIAGVGKVTTMGTNSCQLAVSSSVSEVDKTFLWGGYKKSGI